MVILENIDPIQRLGCKFHGKCHFRIWCRKYLPRVLKRVSILSRRQQSVLWCSCTCEAETSLTAWKTDLHSRGITLLISLRSKNMRDVSYADAFGNSHDLVWRNFITPESAALKSSASSLGPAGLGSSGLLALITERVHWQMVSSTPTSPFAPLPGQDSPFPQRQIPSSRVKHWGRVQKVTGMIFNEEPENWLDRRWICGGPMGTCSPWWKWYASSPPMVVASPVFDNF